MPNLSGQDIGRYHLIEQLGEGGMAVVYKAYDTRLEREVAVKIIRTGTFPPEMLSEVLKRFEREAKSLARLSYPNIVKVHDFGEYDDSPYLVLEYLPGGTLKGLLGKPMPWQEAARLLLPIARGVEYAHQRGIVHRDIKPSNILITESGEPMLSDFGIAKILERDQATALTGSGMAVGTPEYMAPEQWTGSTSPKSDLYSLGVVLYEMVTGRKPYIADTPAAILIKQATEPFPLPRQFQPSLPEEFERLLLKTLAKNPEDRYANMGEFVRALDDLLSTTPTVNTRVADAPAGGATVLNAPPSTTRAPIAATDLSQTPRPSSTALPKPAKSRGMMTPLFLLGGAGVCALLACLVVFGGSYFAQMQTPTETPSLAPPTATKKIPTKQWTASVPPPTETESTPESQPYFTETFTNGLNDWQPLFLGSGSSSDATIDVKNGKLTFNLEGKQIYAYYFYKAYTYTAVHLKMQVVNRGKNSNNISLICNKTESEWYEFSVGNDGLWYLLYQHNGNYFSVQDGGTNAVRTSGANIYEMTCEGNKIGLWVNGSNLKTFAEKKYGLKNGQIGLNISSLTSVPVITEIDYLDIQEP